MHNFGIAIQGALNPGHFYSPGKAVAAQDVFAKAIVTIESEHDLILPVHLQHFTHLQVNTNQIVPLTHPKFQYILIKKRLRQ